MAKLAGGPATMRANASGRRSCRRRSSVLGSGGEKKKKGKVKAKEREEERLGTRERRRK